MPLTAVAIYEDGKRYVVDITLLPSPKAKLSDVKIVCRECGCDMFIRQSLAVRPHFVHNTRSGGTKKCSMSDGGESETHRTCKVAVRDFLRKQTIYQGCKFDFERPLGEDRRCDLHVEFPDGFCEVHEVQVSPVSLDNIKERSLDYERMGLSVFWWLAERVATEDVKQWLFDRYGQFGNLETRIQPMRVD